MFCTENIDKELGGHFYLSLYILTSNFPGKSPSVYCLGTEF
jgi:hypothetical protein